ncbi:hypothetical protein RirG_151720 [Rhizophagus irregularis DAOM 197198w]|uniref:Reverse transcriptase domain-containing protein n=1 Tax=Rhizophagus irregularis (strain DAOM 197198w) TaxID=1432141 RepID=A0A015M9H9_RHIIW|nr:hypothetical protein RirG_151720 [Rhizophagus irregularis DAOM 197198w]
MFQDIAKAFDSISIKGLELALQRIAVPPPIEEVTVSLQFCGEYITTLYTQLPKDNKELGYEISCNWPTNPSDPNSWVKYRKKVAVTAYMDDTAFIESSREGMQKFLNIANSFYNMMNIIINVKKCDLLVFNSPLPKEDNKMIQCQPPEEMFNMSSGKNARNLSKQRIIGIRDVFLQSISSRLSGQQGAVSKNFIS